MSEIYWGYLLTESEHPSHEHIPHKASPAAFVFNQFDGSQGYLHKISYQDTNVLLETHDGHHDGVSSVNFDEQTLLSGCKIEQSWQLTCQQDITALLDSDFVTEINLGLINSKDKFIAALFTINDETVLSWLIQAFDLDFSSACELLPDTHKHLAKLTTIPPVLFNNPENPLDEFDQLSTRLNEHSEQQGFAADSFISVFRENFIKHTFAIDWMDIAQDREYRWRRIGVESLGVELPKAQHDALFVIYSPSHLPNEENTRTHMAANALLRDLNWQDYLLPGDKLDVPGAFLTVLLRREHYHLLEQLFEYADFSIAKECEYFLSRLVISEKQKLIQAFIDKFPHLHQQLMSLKHCCEQPTNIDNDELLAWQMSHDYPLYKNLQHGYGLVVIEELERLSQQGLNTDELSKLLLSASELGFTAIVKHLHQLGGRLDISGHWPMKYANKYSYQKIKQYLLEQGEPDVEFM